MSWAYNFSCLKNKSALANPNFPKTKPFYPPKAECVSVKANTLSDCVNNTVTIDALLTGAVVKVPMVLAELNLQINVDSIISLPEAALEIKDIKKNLKITQCLLLQDTNMLFIRGCVRKNIDYATKGTCFNTSGICGDIRHCTVDVPFNCTTAVDFNGIQPLSPIIGTSEEFKYFKTQDLNGADFSEKSKLLSGDLTEFNQINTEYYNELPYCELIQSRMVEFDEYLNPTHPSCSTVPFEEKEFCKIEEKMVIYLTVKLLQNRQIAVPPLCTTDC
ncbi:MAG: hypothetical protein PHI90_09035 [Clostridia bacterium]|nr:hypothetical protein [Clostridia bacterium]MDD4048942.1 hypothetical protein [Clostridia bacterium]